ncbi:MAG: hypothetical protein ABSH48_08185 [Verrucomicrobiota bacterium]
MRAAERGRLARAFPGSHEEDQSLNRRHPRQWEHAGEPPALPNGWHKVCRRNSMRRILSFLILLAMAAHILGCKKSGESAAKSVRPQMDYNYTYDKREVFIADAGDDLMDLDRNIGALSGKAAASAPLHAAAQPKIQELQNQRAALAKKLATLSTAKPANWNDLKTDYQKSDNEMKASLKAAWQWLADKTRE